MSHSTPRNPSCRATLIATVLAIVVTPTSVQASAIETNATEAHGDPGFGDACTLEHPRGALMPQGDQDGTAVPNVPAALLLGGNRNGSSANSSGSGANAPMQASKEVPKFSPDEIQSMAKAAALRHNLPVEFFTRLIRQESRFKTQVTSKAGAQGIAQFMPRVAVERGLGDPFDPSQALLESAKFLGELRMRFGNLGLAAAAYNAGSRRVQDWLSKRGSLPKQTQDYVQVITGRPVADWAPPALATSILDSNPQQGNENALAAAPQPTKTARPEPSPGRSEPAHTETRPETAPEPGKPDRVRLAGIDPQSKASPLPAGPAIAGVSPGTGTSIRGRAVQKAAGEKVALAPQLATETDSGRQRLGQSGLAKIPMPQKAAEPARPVRAWSVQLAGNFVQSRALASYAELRKKHGAALASYSLQVVKTKQAGRGSADFYEVRVAVGSREAADRLCSSLKAAGSSCTIRRTGEPSDPEAVTLVSSR
jgi:hypothetical protein